MTTIDSLIDAEQRTRQASVQRQDAVRHKITDMALRIGANGSAGLSQEESDSVRKLEDEHTALGGKIQESDMKIVRLQAEKRVDEIVDARQADIHPVATSTNAGWSGSARSATSTTAAYDRVVRIGYESRTYRPDEDPHGKSFLLDVSRSFIFQDPASAGRLQRHVAEERVERSQYFDQQARAAGTGAFAGLTVPQYLTDLYAPAVANMRPFADNCTTHHDLPPAGMTVNISRLTTATSVALQASENSAVSETNADDTLLTLNVQTAAGQQTLSRQAVERGTGIEDVTVQDLFKRYASALDSTLINQAATGLDAVAQALSGGYVDATPTVPELWPKLFANQNNVELALLAQAFPTHHVMHPRRWNWICSQTSSTWPVAGGSLPPQLFANVLSNSYGQGLRGVLSNGMQVVTDANISTTVGAGTEDTIYTVSKDECHLFEDPNAPMLIRAEQPAAASLGILLVVYSYFAYTHSRYTNAAGKINGTGLIAPVF